MDEVDDVEELEVVVEFVVVLVSGALGGCHTFLAGFSSGLYKEKTI